MRKQIKIPDGGIKSTVVYQSMVAASYKMSPETFKKAWIAFLSYAFWGVDPPGDLFDDPALDSFLTMAMPLVDNNILRRKNPIPPVIPGDLSEFVCKAYGDESYAEEYADYSRVSAESWKKARAHAMQVQAKREAEKAEKKGSDIRRAVDDELEKYNCEHL